MLIIIIVLCPGLRLGAGEKVSLKTKVSEGTVGLIPTG